MRTFGTTRLPGDRRKVHDFWFPPHVLQAEPELDAHRRMVHWWFGGGSNADLPPFAPILEAARAGQLNHWLESPMGRLSLVVVLDQFPRGLFAGTPDAYAFDEMALKIAEEGLRNGHYDALCAPWEKTFFFLPLAHTEGASHVERLERAVALAESVAREAPECLRPLCNHSVGQARGHLDVIARFGRFPHRNRVLGRASTPEELAYLAEGNLVHNRAPP